MILLSLAACSFEPIEIGRVPPTDPVPGELTAGQFGQTWDVADLEAGVSEVVSLGILGALLHTPATGQRRRVVIELSPIASAQLPEDLIAIVHTVDGTPLDSFEPSAMGLRFEAELELGWQLELSSNQVIDLMVTAQFVD